MAAAVKVLEGLKILVKYKPDMEVSAQHDVLLVGGPAPDVIDESDLDMLVNLGWHYDIREESWRRFT